MTKHYIIPIFVPHFGCPNDCVFCNQRKITGLSTNLTPYEAENTIIEHLNSFKDNSFIEIAFYGGSFTAIDIDSQKKLLNVAYKYKSQGIVDEIRLSTRPDAIDRKILRVLKEYGVDTIELGIQSLDERVLSLSNRGHSSSQVYSAVDLIKDFKFKLGLQMMLGLPGDTKDSCILTAKEFIKLKPNCVRVYPTLVIKNTKLEKDYVKGLYKPLSMDGAIELSAILLMMFYIHDINVIRVGLQPTDNIQLGKDVVEGPFHPSFRQLVEANILRSILDEYLARLEFPKAEKVLVLQSHSKNISNIAGQNSNNTKYFLNKYNFKKIKIFSKVISDKYIHLTIEEDMHIINLKDEMELLIKNIY